MRSYCYNKVMTCLDQKIANVGSISWFLYNDVLKECLDDIVTRVGVSAVLAKGFGIGYQSSRHF